MRTVGQGYLSRIIRTPVVDWTQNDRSIGALEREEMTGGLISIADGEKIAG